MIRKISILLFTFAAGAAVGTVSRSNIAERFAQNGVVLAQSHKPLMVTRLYTGSDNQTHAEEVELKFGSGGAGNVAPLLQITGAELHRNSPGGKADWHRGPRRQYVITLSGHGELEVAGGMKIPVEPGHIELIEDTTGKGHITRVTGAEDRVTLQMVLADQVIR